MALYVFENKTTSEDIGLGSVFWRRLVLDPQASLYIAAMHAVGMLYNLLRVPQHRPSAKGETADHFRDRVLDVIRQEMPKYYQRGTIVRLQEEHQEAAADVWATAGLIRDARRLKVFPRNADACFQWNRACDYLPTCAGEASIDDPLLFRTVEDPHPELDPAADKRDLLTQSAMRCYRSCPRKYYYRYEALRRPLTEAPTLTRGKSVHKGLEKWFLTGDLQAAVAALDSQDEFRRAKETAMLTGHAERWGEPAKGFISVEKEFRYSLRNPESLAASRTFVLGGRVDAMFETEGEQKC